MELNIDSILAEIFEDLDDDGDKRLTWDEFKDVCCKKDPKSVKANELKELFKKMDKDGSGRLSVDEVQQAFAELEIGSDPQESLDNCDADGDGKVSVEEFINYWTSSL